MLAARQVTWLTLAEKHLLTLLTEVSYHSLLSIQHYMFAYLMNIVMFFFLLWVNPFTGFSSTIVKFQVH